MRDWVEIEARFRNLAEQMRFVRLDFQWGAVGEYWRLAGGRTHATEEFEAIGAIAGRYLDSALPSEEERFARIKAEKTNLHKWYRALKELTNDFGFETYGTQMDDDGNPTGNIYSASIENPVLTSANLCLRLHADFPIPDTRSFGQRAYDDYGKEILVGLAIAVGTALVGLIL